MPNYVIDPARFHAVGAIVDWNVLARRLGSARRTRRKTGPRSNSGGSSATTSACPPSPSRSGRGSGPAQGVEKALNIRQAQLLFLGHTAVTWPEGAMCIVSVDVQAPSGGMVAAFAGAPMLSGVVAVVNLTAGTTTVQISSPVIDGLLVPTGVTVTAVRGVAADQLSQVPAWTPIEQVGLPVKQAEWNGIGKHGARRAWPPRRRTPPRPRSSDWPAGRPRSAGARTSPPASPRPLVGAELRRAGRRGQCHPAEPPPRDRRQLPPECPGGAEDRRPPAAAPELVGQCDDGPGQHF